MLGVWARAVSGSLSAHPAASTKKTSAAMLPALGVDRGSVRREMEGWETRIGCHYTVLVRVVLLGESQNIPAPMRWEASLRSCRPTRLP